MRLSIEIITSFTVGNCFKVWVIWARIAVTRAEPPVWNSSWELKSTVAVPLTIASFWIFTPVFIFVKKPDAFSCTVGPFNNSSRAARATADVSGMVRSAG